MGNSTFASRSGKAVQQAENKAVGPSESKQPTKAELVDRAREQGIEGYSSMTKAELADALGG